MDLEQLRVIWTSQDQKPLFAFDATALCAMIRRRSQAIQRAAAWRKWREVTIGVLAGSAMVGGAILLALGDGAWLANAAWIRNPPSGWDLALLATGGGLWFHYVVFMCMAGVRQRERDMRFETTLAGQIDEALERNAAQLRLSRDIVWRGHVPVWIATLLGVGSVLRLKDASPWVWLMTGAIMAAALALTVWCEHRLIDRRFLPRQRELEALREKLADSKA